MKKAIYIILIFSSFISCDYSNSSNGNIDAAFARETPGDHKEEHHDKQHMKEEKKVALPPSASRQDYYDTTAKEQIEKPLGEVLPTDTVPLGKKGQEEGH